MDMKKLLKKLESYLDKDLKRLTKKKEGISKVLKKLKQKENKLKKMIADEKDDEEIKRLKLSMKIVHTQRKKGIKMLSALRKKKK